MSTPLFQEFDPSIIPWQMQVLNYLNKYDYNQGVLEILFSGSVGSAKSILAAHMIAIHAIENPNSRILVLRRALKDLKRTLWPTILNHLGDIPHIIKQYNKSEMKITFTNGSEIIGDSYDDMNLEKFRSLELSMSVIEEATESEQELYDAVKMRIGRLNKVKKNIFLMLTNPDSPEHYLYTKIITNEGPTRKVFYSLTEQNPFLPKWYIENLKADLDPKMARRMLYGEWIEINKEVIYYAYKKEKNFIKGRYAINPRLPIAIGFDFNIGEGKPYSVVFGQFDGISFHFFDEIIIHGSRTLDSMEEMAQRRLLDYDTVYEIYGDSTGEARSTKSIHSDYDIIKSFLSNYVKLNGQPMRYVMNVPRSNPPIKDRHNIVNGYCENELGKNRLYVYENCKTIDEGLRLTALKKGGQFVEDDSKAFQHCTTALGYYVVAKHRGINSSSIFTSQR